jgi:hypothetical protein
MALRLGRYEKMRTKFDWAAPMYPQLNERQKLAVALAARGAGNTYIGKKLGLKADQVKTWRTRRWWKFSFREQTEAVLASKSEAFRPFVPYGLEVIIDAIDGKEPRVAMEFINRYYEAVQVEGRADDGGKGPEFNPV